MNEKKTFKQEVNEWWDENGRVIKTGATCLLIGAFWGFVKGVGACTNSIISLSSKIPYSDEESDSFEYTEENVDDPELLEIVKFENENA